MEMRIATVKLSLILAVCLFASQVHGEPPVLKFGIEVKQHRLGVEIADILPGRPVSDRLAKGDILRSYEMIGMEGTRFRILRGEDIDKLKTVLAEGNEIILALLRPETRQGDRVYVELFVTLNANDLMRPKEVINAIQSEVQSYSYQAPAEPKPKSEVFVGVFYATDRALEAGKYTGARDRSTNPIKYGVCSVSIPPDHRLGELEGPKFWRFEFTPDPTQHIVLRGVSQIGKEETFRAIASQFEALSQAPRKRLLVFIHGYNVAFDDAARRSAQIHYDLQFPGVSMFYSWPSEATLSGYVSDAADIEWSTPNIRKFLEDLDQRSGIDDIYVLAHSMGNRGLTRALIDLKQAGRGKKIKEIILAAPDIDADLFSRDIAPVLSSFYPRTTIYASSSDRALWASESISGASRVGEIRNGEPTVAPRPKMDLIDASTVATDLLGHSYYGDGDSVISDIKQIIDLGKTPPRPLLKSVTGSLGAYWEFNAP